MTQVIIHPKKVTETSRYLALDSNMKAIPNSQAERSMLANLNGSMGIKKSFRTEPDGSVTMMATKNGMPEITNSGT